MDVEKKYKLAMRLYNEGKSVEALDLLLAGYPEVKDLVLKLNYIMFLVTLIDPVFKVDEIIALCDDGLKITAGAKDKGAFYYLQMRKAVCYKSKSAEMLSVKKDITLAPGRINFALESDRDLYFMVNQKIDELDKLTDELTTSSLKLANANDYNLQAHMYSMVGDIYSARCSRYILEHMRYAKLLYKFGFLGLRPQHLLKWTQRGELKKILSHAKNAYLTSVKFYKKNNDPTGVACSFSNLSNHLRTFGFYGTAKKYLVLSKKASSAKSVAVKRDLIEANINDKNKNIPDYKQQFPRPVLRRNSGKNLRTKLRDWFSNLD